MREVTVGREAPAFRLPAAQGGEVGPEDYRGQRNLILFFAKGMACGFCRQKMSQLARGLSRFRALDAEILMVSPTPLPRGKVYARSFTLPFPYLCDPDYRVFEMYGMPVRPHSLLWKARVFASATRLPPPEDDFAALKPSPTELPRLFNDDDLGFFILDKPGIVQYSNSGPYTIVEGTKIVGMHSIPSNEEIAAELERCQRTSVERRPA
jgi:peroxiredoxin